MEIYVNDQRLDAQLSGEKSVDEVFNSVTEWIASNRSYILGFMVDGRDVARDDLKNLAIPDTGRIDFFVGDEGEMMISTVEELDRYLDQIGGTLYDGVELSRPDLMHLKEGVHWIRQILNSLSSILKIYLTSTAVRAFDRMDLNSILDRLDLRANELIQEFHPETVELFLDDLRGIKQFALRLAERLRTMYADFDSVVEVVTEFDEKLSDLTDSIVSVNESFHMGREQEALDSLNVSSDRLSLYLAALHAIDYRLQADRGEGIYHIEFEGVTLEERIGRITELLHGLSNALEERDLVTAGDILEYELTETLHNLKPYLTGIRQFVVARN
jgi:hypothetical protein